MAANSTDLGLQQNLATSARPIVTRKLDQLDEIQLQLARIKCLANMMDTLLVSSEVDMEDVIGCIQVVAGLVDNADNSVESMRLAELKDHHAPDADGAALNERATLLEVDQLLMKAGQLRALLNNVIGEQFETFSLLTNDHKEKYLGACENLAKEIENMMEAPWRDWAANTDPTNVRPLFGLHHRVQPPAR